MSALAWSGAANAGGAVPWEPLDWKFQYRRGVLSPGYTARHNEALPPKALAADETRSPVLVVLGNPALGVLGKWGVRAELVPLAAHGVFVEFSSINLRLTQPKLDASGSAWEVGYHLFPEGHRGNGFYVGPRYFTATGSVNGIDADSKGFGGDFGIQWVWGAFAFNLGAGVIRATTTFRPPASPENLPEGVEIPEKIVEKQWVPIAVFGLGLAFLGSFSNYSFATQSFSTTNPPIDRVGSPKACPKTIGLHVRAPGPALRPSEDP